MVISHPANCHVIPGGVNISQIKLSSYVVDPIYYGLRRAFRSTTLFFHFKNKLVHRTHQILCVGHHLFGKLDDTQLAIRVGLQEKCVICKTLPVNFKGADLAYLDHLTTGYAAITRLDNLSRTEGESVWRPRYKAYSKHGLRSALKVNALVITCINNSAVTIWVLETQETPSQDRVSWTSLANTEYS